MTNLKHWTRWFKKKTPGKKLSPKTGKTETGYTYVMSDLHGCFDELNAMLAKIGFSDQDKLICCCAAIMRKNFYVIWSCFWQCRRSGSL